MKNCLSLALKSLTVFACLASASAFAEVETFGPDVPQLTGSLTFDKYSDVDPLTAVFITFQLSAEGAELMLDNESPVSSNVEYTFDTDAEISFGSWVLPISLFWTDTTSLGADDGDGKFIQPGGADYAEISVPNDGGFASLLITDPAQLVYFQGPGTFSMDYMADTLASVFAPGVAFASFPPLVAGRVEVFYNPDATVIPEPSEIAIFAGAILFGCLAFRRRRA